MIKKLCIPNCEPVIPTVYTDSLSIYEEITKQNKEEEGEEDE